MFSGDGRELETISFPVPRQDDGLLWGDYSMRRIEPCNRVDRFLSAVAYLDGERPSVIIGRGYYTRTTVTAYDFRSGRFEKRFTADEARAIYPQLTFLPRTQWGYAPCLCGKKCDLACYRHLTGREI